MNVNGRTQIRVATQNLGQLLLFRDVEEQALSSLAAVFECYTYGEGSQVLTQVDLPDTIYIVGTGIVRLYRLPRGQEVTFLYLRAGHCFSLHDRHHHGEPRSYAEVLTRESTIYSTIERRFRPFVIAYPAIGMAIIDQLLASLLECGERIEDLASRDIRDRLIRALARIATPDQSEIPTSQRELAALIGTSPDRVNKMLAQLRDEGLIAYERRKRGIRLLVPFDMVLQGD